MTPGRQNISVLLLMISLLMLSPGFIKSAHAKDPDEKKNLMDFAYANCMYWYFKSKHYDLKDISAIAGGYVEMGHSGMEKYQAIADYIQHYKTKRQTKQHIDPQLLKCFYLDENQGLLRIINSK